MSIIDVDLKPSDFRFARKPDGRLILQGAYHWHSETELSGGIEWKDLPVVDVDENGKEID